MAQVPLVNQVPALMRHPVLDPSAVTSKKPLPENCPFPPVLVGEGGLGAEVGVGLGLPPLEDGGGASPFKAYLTLSGQEELAPAIRHVRIKY